MEISGKTRLTGFFAQPARHSISPKMHNTAFQALEIDAVYLAFEISPNQLAAAVQSIKTLDMLGVNVSMPHKTKVIAYLDQLSPAAKLIGAVNTIVNQNGRLIGHNTDGSGFMASLADLEVEVIGQGITILGGGGAAIAIIVQAAMDGVKEINVAVRNLATKYELQQKLSEISHQTNCAINMLELTDRQQLAQALATSCLLINGTNVGMAPDTKATLIDPTWLRPDLAVYDIIYNPRQTQLLKDAQAAGAKTANGLPMLVYQGAEAFELWTGKKMPLELIKPIVNNS